ncbi:MAG: 4-hydroxy-tetrahydrodipicolinate reductase [Clostridiales bacterium]|nr:4-hydroxy-tetrahydrodipicolinate reductase [Clostridiales bacterium]
MINLAICGINGTMGKYVYEQAVKQGVNVVCGIDKISVGTAECPIYKTFDEIKDFVDVIIDFSSPDITDSLLSYAKENNVALVIATTGHTPTQEQKILECSKYIPIFKSANTSIGVNLVLKLCKESAKALDTFDVEIIDKHHKNKKDSPSGTSFMIFNEINKAKNSELSPIHGRKGKTKRKPCEVGIHAVRGGTTVGTHEINFFGEHESITIIHTAHSKELFAIGALKAAEFIKNNECRMYSMDDII